MRPSYQGEALVVVEGDHDLLPLTEPVDRPGQDALHLLGLEDGHRVLGALVLQGVDQAESVAPLGADREQLVQGDLGLLDLTGLEPDRTRDPVDGSQLLDDRALDPRDRVRLERDAASRSYFSIASIRPKMP